MTRAESIRAIGAGFMATAATARAADEATAIRRATHQREWASTDVHHRLRWLRRVRHAIAEQGRSLASVLAQERNRPVAECMSSEVLPLVAACRFLEREAPGILQNRVLARRGLPLWLSGVRSEVRRVPLGCVLVIGPGNYPLFLPGVQLLQALVAGNSTLLKPGRGCGGTAGRLRDLFVQAGLPEPLLQVLPDTVEATGAAIRSRPDHVVFTGSTAAGEVVLAQSSTYGIPATLELGGSDAVIVREDADPDLAARAICFGLMLNGGRTCMAPRRIFGTRGILDQLQPLLMQKILEWRRDGKPSPDPHADPRLGIPESVRCLIREAVEHGAKILTLDGCPSGEAGSGPWILRHVPPESRILREEVFAPVLCLVEVDDESEVIRIVNSSAYGLGAGIFSADEAAARDVAERLDVGVVSINDLILPTADPRLPFGGRRRSGFGVTRGAEGLLQMTSPQVITRTRAVFRPALHPSRAGDESLFAAYLQAAHSSGWKSRLRGIADLLRCLSRRK